MQSVLTISLLSSGPADPLASAKADPDDTGLPSFGESFAAPDLGEDTAAGSGDGCGPALPVVIWTGAAMAAKSVPTGGDGTVSAANVDTTTAAGVIADDDADAAGTTSTARSVADGVTTDRDDMSLVDCGQRRTAHARADGVEAPDTEGGTVLHWGHAIESGAWAGITTGTLAGPPMMTGSVNLMQRTGKAAESVDQGGPGPDALPFAGMGFDPALHGSVCKTSPPSGLMADPAPLAATDAVLPSRHSGTDAETATGAFRLPDSAMDPIKGLEGTVLPMPGAEMLPTDALAAPGKGSHLMAEASSVLFGYPAASTLPTEAKPQPGLDLPLPGGSSMPAPVEARPTLPQATGDHLSAAAAPTAARPLPQGKAPGFWERFFTDFQNPVAADPARTDLPATPEDRPAVPTLASAEVPLALGADTRTVTTTEPGSIKPRRSGGESLPVMAARPGAVRGSVAFPNRMDVPAPGDEAVRPALLFPHADQADQQDLSSLLSISASGAPLPGPLPTSPASLASGLHLPQIARQITGALARSNDGATEFALSPDELGHVRLRLEPDAANPDRMVVMITFERPETMDLFRRHAGELADALRAAGYAGADIGFGQEGGEGFRSDHRKRADDLGHDSFEPVASPDLSAPALRPMAGASLDLRL